MFILKSPGITLSPALWSGLQEQSRFAAMGIAVSCGAPAGPPS